LPWGDEVGGGFGFARLLIEQAAPNGAWGLATHVLDQLFSIEMDVGFGLNRAAVS
jgi:hypothetical protein